MASIWARPRAEEGVHLLDAPQHGQGRRVGQVPLHGAPDPLDRVVVRRIASAVQQADARVPGQPALDGPAGVRADTSTRLASTRSCPRAWPQPLSIASFTTPIWSSPRDLHNAWPTPLRARGWCLWSEPTRRNAVRAPGIPVSAHRDFSCPPIGISYCPLTCTGGDVHLATTGDFEMAIDTPQPPCRVV